MSFLIFNLNKNFIYVIAHWILDIPICILINLKEEYYTMNENIIKNEYMYLYVFNF